MNRFRRDPAIRGTFAAHLSAQLAMFVVMPFALRRAFVADTGAQFEHLAQHLFVRAGAANRKLAGRLTDVGAIEARADALAHIHLLGRAGVRAAKAHPRAIH